NVSMTAGEEKDFGAIHFEPGASVAGTIATPRGRQEETVVELTPAPAPSSSQAQKTKPRRVVVKGANGGLFQFTAVPKGAYRLTASRPGWLRAEVKSVRVEDGRESFLEKPLQLVRAAVIDVFITPPLSTEEEPWLVRLESSGGVMNRRVAESAASFSGEWRSEALKAGKYVLSVVDRHDNVFRRETIEASVDAAPQFLKIIKVHVRGLVKMGTVPYESQLVFSDDENSAEITLQADAAGKFEGILSHQGRWFVEVDNPAKRFYVKDIPVEVKRAPEQDVASVVVAMPGGKVKGRVTNKAGEPAQADVVVFRNGKVGGNGGTLPDGSFQLEGLEPGPVTLLAIARGAESDMVSYLAAEDDPAIVQILLEELVEVKCRLLSEDGYPIAGAVIRYSASGMTRRREAISDPMGEFSIRIPQDTHSLLAAIIVDGFPVTVRQLDPESTETQRVILGTASASLHIVLRPGGGSWPLITFDGQAFLSITSLLGLPLPDGRVGMVDDGIQVPMAPGVYTICSARGESACQTARVAAGHDQTVVMDGAKSK
ncbi:MAG TPA: carboxypeptidase-like regulatory domain-containing protein, partial [Thermoanaerobaculia bacterium]|nr:carboxypeptidase-like regulatory domain-containing protein [Thermoanaerobaculia bacterium]